MLTKFPNEFTLNLDQHYLKSQPRPELDVFFYFLILVK